MNCEKCVQLLSDFHDGKLKSKDQALLDAHFEECVSCAGVRQDLRSVVSVARELREVMIAPPNERALWLRISNTVEHDHEKQPSVVEAWSAPFEHSRGVWTRLTGKRWELSLPQLSTAIAAIILSVSLLTAIAIRSSAGDSAEVSNDLLVRSNPGNELIVSEDTEANFNPDEMLRQQQSNINYWQQRVEQRKRSWRPQMQEAFDRNIKVIDQAVNDSLIELRSNPNDRVCEEMFDAALRDKMELLKEFSEF